MADINYMTKEGYEHLEKGAEIFENGKTSGDF
jgi:hypothetical protein